MIPIAKPTMGNEEKQAVLSVLESGMLAQGPKVKEFEQAFANFVGAKHAIATSNGTTALHVALIAHNIGKGDEVITSPFSFIATANTITMTGATPVFVDVDEKTFTIDTNLIEKAITPRTRAIMPVHLYGNPAEMGTITAIAKKHNLLVIEDACQAHGARYVSSQGIWRNVGSEHTSCFSFYPTKNITTGEGGMIVTNDDTVAAKIRKLIAHGSTIRYYHDYLGYNYRMTDIAAAIGIEQLKKLYVFNKKRCANAMYLTKKLQTTPGIMVPTVKYESSEHVFHQYTIRITQESKRNRDNVSAYLVQHGIGNAIFYPVPIHKQKAYLAFNSQCFPVTEKLASQVLSLPVHPFLSEQDLDEIVRCVQEAVKEAN